MDPRDPPTPQHQLIPVPVINHAANSRKTSKGMNVLTILLLIFIYPIGVFVMWFGTKWSLIVKLLITGLGVIFFAIFAILVVVGLTVFTGLQRGERDAVRRSDIDQITIALERHFDVVMSQYPPLQPDWFSTNAIPRDPLGGSYEGVPAISVPHFKICANLETETPKIQYCKESTN